MKQILLLSLLALMLLNKSFACGGCRDSYLGSNLANTSKDSYNNGESEIFKAIQSLNAILETQIIKVEQTALKEKEILLHLQKYTNLKEQSLNFYLKSHIELQGIINSIKAIRE
ncbi:hypothetical protein [Helicobacter turcicus]|uniref:Uncharacterized protein n=1 Tax=Helicobacter turcicus TaxID=2867412 RepID=A0ABS7JPG5_9HELI|nr:hypothetical protein [Helicobacter turcicus]MBX7491258.1 hypothetical protein [Helicobacter turcicus]MBX7546103.1 hypothetical protein [Helicobacter turcicus]